MDKIVMDYTQLISSFSPFIVELVKAQYGKEAESKTFELVYNEAKITWELNVYD